ncbi:MAG: DNA internalization-related competence protein ComEC/Rec2 [Rhodocyclaceae bacterium]|nr:DNA internalization-related competence protein ComEC/Rec2 [Rhodocyclaceae bacterium]
MKAGVPVFAIGVASLQLQAALPSLPWIAAGFALMLLLTIGACYRKLRWPVLLAALLAGFCWAALRAELRLQDHLPTAWEGRDIELLGIVAEMPQPFARGVRFTFAVEQVLTEGAVVPPRIALSWYEAGQDAIASADKVRPGERWRLTVRLKRPHGNANPFGFDYEAWLLERDLRATGYVRAQPVPERLATFVAAPAYAVERLRYAIRDRFLADLAGADYAGILVALAVGDQRAIQGEFWRVFSRTGTTHLMSISGLHVTMIAALIGGLVGWLWRRSPRLMILLAAQRAAVLAGAAAALAYALLSGFSVPAQRTACMLLVAAIALLSGRRTAPSQVLGIALAAVLLLDPWAVLAPGFWLSFGAVALLFYVSTGRSPFPVTGWRDRLAAWGVAQWAITIASLPILLFFFSQFSLVSPLANALAIPIVSLVVTPLALLAMILPLSLLLDIAHGLLSWLMAFLIMLADFPLLERPAPPLPMVALGVLGIVWMLLPRGIPRRGLGAVLLLPALLYVPPRPAPGEAWITVLDVGQGLAVVVRTASKTLLYDTGPLFSAESDAGQRIVVPHLRALGIGRLDAMMVTHGDSDHAGGAASVLDAMPVDALYSTLAELPGETCHAGQRWEWEGVRFEVLHPQRASVLKGDRRPNHLSCVLRVTAGGHSMLLTSDIEAEDERELLARTPESLHADVLLVPHHGSLTSSTPGFVAAVGASDAIIAAGYRNRFGHPRPQVLARYSSARAWRTDLQGAIEVRLGAQLDVAAWRERRARYWYGR